MNYLVSVFGQENKKSASWTNAIRYALAMSRKYKGEVVTIKSLKRNEIMESFKWCEESNDMIPATWN